MVLQQCLACNSLVSETNFGRQVNLVLQNTSFVLFTLISRPDFDLLSMVNTAFVPLLKNAVLI